MTHDHPTDRSEEEKPFLRRSAEDEALPTADIPAEFLTSSYLATNELHLLSFYLPGRSNPIIINGSKTITIGRRDPKKRISPTLDLTEDNGAKLGVSRLHAEISYVNGRYYVKDLDSANGTWVNEAKLLSEQPFPIDSGDQIRLGQLAIVVHISMPQRRVSQDVISTVLDEVLSMQTQSYVVLAQQESIALVGNQGGIIPGVVTALGKYIEHLSAMYTILRKAQQMPDIGFAVMGIRVRQDDKALILDVAEGEDLMTFVAQKMPEFVKVLDGQERGTKKQTDSLQRYPTRHEQIADYALQQLVMRFLHDERDAYVEQMAIHIKEILQIGLQFSITDNK
jgi:pSer/pThr/pTyr-binding forkhead associated (FHA) protein